MAYHKTYFLRVPLTGDRPIPLQLESGEEPISLEPLPPGYSPWGKFDEALDLIRGRDRRELSAFALQSQDSRAMMGPAVSFVITTVPMPEVDHKKIAEAIGASKRFPL